MLVKLRLMVLCRHSLYLPVSPLQSGVLGQEVGGPLDNAQIALTGTHLSNTRIIFLLKVTSKVVLAPVSLL